MNDYEDGEQPWYSYKSEIKEITMVKDNEDGTKQYKIVSESKVDLRKKIFEVLPKEDITIFELKKSETTLEDAFMKLIEGGEKSISQKHTFVAQMIVQRHKTPITKTNLQHRLILRKTIP